MCVNWKLTFLYFRWWEVPLHDKALLQGICKHGIGRHDLMIMDKELPFHKIVEKNIENSDIDDPNLQSTSNMLIRIAWPKELVIARRIDALCELILRPKQQKRSRNRKPKPVTALPAPSNEASSSSAMRVNTGGKTLPPRVGGKTIAASMMPPPHLANRRYLSDVETDSDEDDDDDDEEDERQKRMRYDIQQQRIPTKPLKSQGLHRQRYNNTPFNHTPATTTSTTSTSSPDSEMEEGEISDSDDDQYYTGYPA